MFKGQPVTKGSVNFSNEAGEGAEAKLNSEGSYVVETPAGGLPYGEYIVTVTPETYLDNSDPKTPPVMEESPAPDIPEKYRRTGSTPLRHTVKEGKTIANFELQP